MEKIIEFTSLPSTNLYLKENYEQLPNKTVVIASHQTAGRGRLDRVWEDSDDLLFSILLKNHLPDNITNISLLVAASLYKTLIKDLEHVTIKWPNDILVDGKKLVGILLESIVVEEKIECIIIGIGINVNTTKMREALTQKATSMYLQTNKQVDKKTLLNNFLKEFIQDYQLYCEKKSDYLQICREHSYVIGKEVNIFLENELKKAQVLTILENGNLLVLVGDRKIELHSGEITLTELYK